MASFHAKTSWKRPRKSEKQNLSFRSVPTRPGIENSKKIGKKKIKKHHDGFFSSQNKLGKVEKE